MKESTQGDVTIEEVVVHPNGLNNDGRTEMEELEHHLDAMMHEQVQQALQLQALRDGFNGMAPILGYRFLPAATGVLRFIGITYWAFFVVRFVCMADMSLLICLLGSVSLICLTFAFATEQHLFFWPFAFVNLLETLISVLQLISLSLLIHRSDGKVEVLMNEITNHEDLFGNSVLDEMQSWRGVVTIELYICFKMIAFPIAFMICVQVARIFHDKEDILQAQELNMDIHHQRMTQLIHRIEMLRRNQPVSPPQQFVDVVPAPPPQQCNVPQVPTARVASNSRSMPNIGRFRPTVRLQQSAQTLTI